MNISDELGKTSAWKHINYNHIAVEYVTVFNSSLNND